MPRFDAWHAWTHVARAALGASFSVERIPGWLPALSVAGLVGMSFWVARGAFLAERADTRAPMTRPPDIARVTATPAAPPAPRRLA